MLKKDLKTGMVVELGTGEKYLVMLDSGIKNIWRSTVDLVSLNGGWMSLESYNDDLKLKNDEKSDWNIVKVYNPDLDIQFMFNNLDAMLENLKVVWERESEPIVMTIPEIEEKLGIKNLKIKGEN